MLTFKKKLKTNNTNIMLYIMEMLMQNAIERQYYKINILNKSKTKEKRKKICI